MVAMWEGMDVLGLYGGLFGYVVIWGLKTWYGNRGIETGYRNRVHKPYFKTRY